jgi:hypothetical protein
MKHKASYMIEWYKARLVANTTKNLLIHDDSILP